MSAALAAVHVAIDAALAGDWPEPEPLLRPEHAAAPYPLDALPAVVSDAVTAYGTYGQQPIALVASSALSSASLVVQGLVDVARDRNLVGPCSLSFAIIAESGERKTSCDRRMGRAVRAWQKAKREEMAPEVEAAKSKIDVYLAARDGLLGKIKAGRGNPTKAGDLDRLQSELLALDAARPRELLVPALFNEDVTPEVLGREVARGWPSSSLWSDEGGLVVGGHGMNDESAMRYLALLNRLWDGRDFDRKRVSAPSFTVRGRRFTVSLMMQHVVLARLLSTGGGASRGVGALARLLLAAPESTMGGRLYREGDLEAPALVTFDRTLTDLLDLPLPAEGDDMALTPPALALDAPARRDWIAFHDDVERELGREGEFAEVADFAAKTAENAARLAGVLHTVQHGPAGEIDAETFGRAAAVAAWHLHEARRLVGAARPPEAVSDAAALLGWLARREGEVEPRTILKDGPRRLRDKARRDAALRVLCETQNVVELVQGRTTRLLLNPHVRRAPR